MSYEEVIQRLKDHFERHKDRLETPYLDQAVDIMFNTLKKQIALSPKLRYGITHFSLYGSILDEYGDIPTCPICEHDLDKHSHYCLSCGQKIKWKEDIDDCSNCKER